MTAHDDDWHCTMLPFDPAARSNRALCADRPAATSAPAPQSARRSPEAVLDDLRDKFKAVVLGAPIAPTRRFYSNGRLCGLMQIKRTRVR